MVAILGNCAEFQPFFGLFCFTILLFFERLADVLQQKNRERIPNFPFLVKLGFARSFNQVIIPSLFF